MASADGEFKDEDVIKAIPKEYTFLKLLGKGGYGKVVKCVKKETGEEVAIKMMYSHMAYDEEAEILEKMKDARLDRANMVKFLEQIETAKGKALVFECLDMTLYKYTKKVFPLPLCDVRAIINQMAVALACLETFGYVHTDVKPDNIMFRGTGRPLQVKLIDFGLIMPLTEAKEGMTVSLLMFRAPEVFFGCPYNGAMDVWALGISIACVMINTGLFPEETEYGTIRAIVKLLGQPPDKLLNQGCLTSDFFNKCGKSWKLKTKKQYAKEYSVDEVPGHFTEEFPSLRSVMKKFYEIRGEDMVELDCCIDLLEKMLDVNWATRIRAADIGSHPFIKKYRDNIPAEKLIPPAQQMTDEEEEKENTTTESTSSSEPSIDLYTTEEVQVLLAEQYTVVCMQGVDDFDHQIVKCKRKDTGEVVSVKISFNGRDPFKEARLLNRMMRKGLEKKNIARYLETVDFGTSQALVFEELDRSLADYLYRQRKISILEARTITQQAATALAALQELKVIHANLSMDSIWFSDVRRNRIKIKLMDFSSAMYSKDVREGMILWSQHRAPEIILGLPITEAVDVWSLGNILAIMLLGFSIFPQEGEFKTLKVMVALLGLPPDEILNAGTKVTHFFKKTAGSWKLMTDEEYAESQGLNPCDIRPHYAEKFKSLKHLIKKKVNGGMFGDLYHDDCADLLSQMFQVDATKRIKPRQILQHRFFQEDSSDSEVEEEEEGETRPPPQVKAARPEDTKRVPCITELSRLEHELVAPETVQVFPDRIDNTLLTLHCAKDVSLDQRIPLGHTIPRFHSFQPYASGLPGVETGTIEPWTSKKSSTNSKNRGNNIQTTTWSGGSKTKSASTSGGSKTQDASTSDGSKTQDASTSDGSKTQSASTSDGSKTQSTSASGGSKIQSASTSGGSKIQDASTSGGSKTQSASTSERPKTQSASTFGRFKTQSASTFGRFKTHSASTSGGSKTQSASTSRGIKHQSGSMSGKSEDCNNGGNNQRVPLKMIKEEPEEEEEKEKKKKEEKKEKKKKKKNCLRRMWSWMKKHLSCCNYMDE